jgi:hypothetical protein
MALLKESLKPLGFLQPNILAIILGERGFDDSEQKNCAIRTRKAGSTWSPPSSGRRFVVLLTKVDDPSWLDENRVDIEKDFPFVKKVMKDVKPSVVQTITVFVSFAQLIVMLAAAA